MGALIEFQNKDFGVRFLNDRGIIEVDLFSLVDKDYSINTALLQYLIKVERRLIVDRWSEKTALSKVLSALETVDFLKTDYSSITRKLNPECALQTKMDIQSAGERRSKGLFPQG